MSRLPTLDRDFSTLQATAEALLRQCPRLELMSFVRRMGLPIKGGRNSHGIYHAHPGKQAKAAIAVLEQAGIIQLQAPTAIRESVMVCRPGYQPRQPGSGHHTPCTISFDPFLKGAWQPGDKPVRPHVADIPTAVNWREAKPCQPSTPTESTDMTRTRENRERVLAAIALAEQEAIERGTYKLPSRNQLGTSLGLEDYFYAGTQGGKQATAEYNAAQTRLTLKRAEVESQQSAVDQQPTTNNQQYPHTVRLSAHVEAPHRSAERSRRSPTPDPYQLRLEADNTRLRAEIEALRAQTQQAPTSSDQALLQVLKAEDRQLRFDAAGLLDRITEMEQTRQQLLSNADVIQRLIEQREGAIEQSETAVVAVAETNGHRQLAGVK